MMSFEKSVNKSNNKISFLRIRNLPPAYFLFYFFVSHAPAKRFAFLSVWTLLFFLAFVVLPLIGVTLMNSVIFQNLVQASSNHMITPSIPSELTTNRWLFLPPLYYFLPFHILSFLLMTGGASSSIAVRITVAVPVVAAAAASLIYTWVGSLWARHTSCRKLRMISLKLTLFLYFKFYYVYLCISSPEWAVILNYILFWVKLISYWNFSKRTYWLTEFCKKFWIPTIVYFFLITSRNT